MNKYLLTFEEFVAKYPNHPQAEIMRRTINRPWIIKLITPIFVTIRWRALTIWDALTIKPCRRK